MPPLSLFFFFSITIEDSATLSVMSSESGGEKRNGAPFGGLLVFQEDKEKLNMNSDCPDNGGSVPPEALRTT